MDKIRIDDLEVSCIIGILPDERRHAQPLILSAEIGLDVTGAAVSGDLDRSLDYARLADDLVFLLKTANFRLLESAALALCHYLLLPAGVAATRARVSLRKPLALGGRGVPSLVVERTPAELVAAPAATPAEIFRCPDALIQRLAASAPPVRPAGYSRHVDRALIGDWVLRLWTP